MEVKTETLSSADLRGLMEFGRRHREYRPFVLCDAAEMTTIARIAPAEEDTQQTINAVHAQLEPLASAGKRVFVANNEGCPPDKQLKMSAYSSASTRSFAAAPKPRPHCRARTLSLRCYMDCCGAARSCCAASMAGTRYRSRRLTPSGVKYPGRLFEEYTFMSRRLRRDRKRPFSHPSGCARHR
jgi:hypothetical protein